MGYLPASDPIHAQDHVLQGCPCTKLHHAVFDANEAEVARLLTARADPNIEMDPDGGCTYSASTPFYWAAHCINTWSTTDPNSAEVMLNIGKLLLAHGANPMLVNLEGCAPINKISTFGGFTSNHTRDFHQMIKQSKFYTAK